MLPSHLDSAPPSPRSHLLAFAGVTLLVFIVFGVTLANPDRFPKHPDVGHTWDGFDNPWLDGYARWDGGWYKTIAVEGYYYTTDRKVQTPVPFFPLYPLLMRGAGQLGPAAADGEYVDSRSALYAGIGLSLLASCLALVAFGRWCTIWLGPERGHVAVLTLVCYPLSYYLAGLVYSEALFVCLAIGAFYALERDRIPLAILLGAAATATRPVGFGVFVGLFVRQLERQGVIGRRGILPTVDLSRWRWRDLTLLLTAAGALGYLGYLFRFAEPGLPGWKVYLMSGAADGWYMEPGPKVWFKVEAINRLSEWPWRLKQLLILFHGSITLTAIALLPAIVRRFGWGYCAYTLVVLGMPSMASKDFIAMGRYLLPAFPCLALVGAWLYDRPRGLRLAAWGGGLVAMALFASRFVRWYYVS